MEITILLLLIIIILLIILYKNNISLASKEQPVEIITTVEEPQEPQNPLPYWVWYGQPWYTPVYTSPYWFYDVPFYGPITGGSYQQAWGRHTRPGRGHPGPAMGGSTGVAHGGGGGGGHGGH
jgi:hypothetical protein